MRLSPRGMGVRITNASGALTGMRSLCSRSGLALIPARKRKVRYCPFLNPAKTSRTGIPILRMRLSPRGMGVRITNASGTSTGVRSLCSRSGLVTLDANACNKVNFSPLVASGALKGDQLLLPLGRRYVIHCVLFSVHRNHNNSYTHKH